MQHGPVIVVVGVVVVVVGDMDVVVVVVVLVGVVVVVVGVVVVVVDVVVVVVGVVVVVVGTLSHSQAIGQRIFTRGRIAEDFFSLGKSKVTLDCFCSRLVGTLGKCGEIQTSGPLGTVFG